MAVQYSSKKPRTQSLPKCFPPVFTSNSLTSSAKQQCSYEELQHSSYLNHSTSFYSASPEGETLSLTTKDDYQSSNCNTFGNLVDVSGSGTNDFQFCREDRNETTQNDNYFLALRRVPESNSISIHYEKSEVPSDIRDPSRFFSPETPQELCKPTVDWVLGPSFRENLPSNAQENTTINQSSLLSSLKVATPAKISCNQGRSCMQAAIETLWSLHTSNVSNFCLSNNNLKANGAAGFVSPRSSEDVLQKNKEIEKVLSSVLACACSERPRVQVLLVNICHRLLIWYKAVVPCHKPLLSIATSFMGREEPGETISHQPIRIGEYCLDEALELRIKAQVVFAELQKLEILISILVSRMTTERKIAGYSNKSCDYSESDFIPTQETEFSEHVRGKLATLLHRKLQTMMIDLKGIYVQHA